MCKVSLSVRLKTRPACLDSSSRLAVFPPCLCRAGSPSQYRWWWWCSVWKIMVSRHTQRQNLQSWWARRGNDYRVWRLALIWTDYLYTNLATVCPHLDYHLRHHPPLITNTGDINSCLQTTIALVISSFTETLRDSGRQNKTFNELLSSHKKRSLLLFV